MATYTSNLNLTKPDSTDKINVYDLSNNFQKIDDRFGSTPTNQDFNEIKAALGDINAALDKINGEVV